MSRKSKPIAGRDARLPIAHLALFATPSVSGMERLALPALFGSFSPYYGDPA